MPQSIGKRWVAILIAVLLLVVSAVTMAFFTDRVDHSMQFTTASFSADGYKLTRTAPEGPFCAGEEVTATLKESNTGDDDVNSIISMKATWVSPDTALSIFGNANAADNAKLSIDGTDISYKVSTDKKSITFDLPKQVLAAGTKDAARDLTLTIPASFKSTGRIEFTFEKVVVAQEGGGFSKEYSRTDLNAASDLDYSVRVGWAASSIEAQNGKALMGYLTDKNASGKFGIEFELAFNYAESPMKDFSSRTGAKWSYYKGAVDRLTFVEGMTTIGDYAFPDFSAVKSVSFPTTVKTIGLSAFDASGLTGTVTIPATVKEIKSLAFGNLPNVKTFTFGHTTDSLTLPDNTAAGKRNTGAFYVPTHVDTTVNTTVEAIMYGYKWHDGYDNRRLVPTLNAQDTWYKGTTAKSAITGIEIVDSYSGASTESWDASAAQDGSVMAYVNGTKLTIAGNGAGKIMANADSSSMFNSFFNSISKGAASISGLNLLDTSNVTNMNSMFSGCKALGSVGDISGWNTANVTDMQKMFDNCWALKSLNLSGWNTANVTDMFKMFYFCNTLTSLDVSGWNTSNVTCMSFMFAKCPVLASLDLSGFDPSKVTLMAGMFEDSNALTSVGDLSGWNTANVTNMKYVFSACSSLTSLDLSGWDTSNVTIMDGMFESCAALTNLNLSSFDTSKVGTDDMYDMFSGCRMLQTVTLGKDFKFGSTSSYLPAPSSTYITGANGKWYDTSDGTWYTPAELASVTRTETRTFVAVKPVPTLAAGSGWYKGSTGRYTITEIELVDSYTATGNETESWDASAAQDGSVKAYINGTKLTIAGNGAGKIMANAKSNSAFDSFGNVTTISGLDKLDTANVTDMRAMFTTCMELTSLDLSGWDTSNVTNMSRMFNNCMVLTSLDLSGWDTSNVTNMYSMFASCNKLTSLDLSGFDTSKVTNMGAMFQSLTNLTSLDLSGWDTAKVTDMSYMFNNSWALTSLDLSSWDTAKVTDMNYMFKSCRKLTKIYASNLWSTASVTRSTDMFGDCSKLRGKISYNSSKTDATYANYTTGYLTYRAAPARSMSIMSSGSEISGYSISE